MHSFGYKSMLYSNMCAVVTASITMHAKIEPRKDTNPSNMFT